MVNRGRRGVLPGTGTELPARTLVRAGVFSISKENTLASEQSLDGVAVDSELLRQVSRSSTCLVVHDQLGDIGVW
jgi:hypothetical protein